MEDTKNRREHRREAFETPEVGIVILKDCDKENGPFPDEPNSSPSVSVLNRCEGGLLFESDLPYKIGAEMQVQIRLTNDEIWYIHEGKVAWIRATAGKHRKYLVGIKSFQADSCRGIPHGKTADNLRMRPEDLDFLMKTPLIDSIPQKAKCPLLNCMKPHYRKKGERIISQGDEGDFFFLIQEGSCVINIQKGDSFHPIARLGAGDIVGEMAILTGEQRNAHVDAENDLRMWTVTRSDFDLLCEKYPDLRNFLTKLITRRFSSLGPIAERTIGKYVIDEVIGKGGWSIVYRGLHQSLNMPVAIKMLKHDMAMNQKFLGKFHDEARTIAKMNHMNIVKVYDIEELYRTVFIIMEFLDGVPLNHVLETIQRLSEQKTIDIILQLCSGLAYAHERGIIHHDIKPANIFIQSDNRVKIVDFGLACAPGTVDTGWTGTIHYMSPEQIEGNPVDEKTDIYSLGVTAFEMITGRKPFQGESMAKVLNYRLSYGEIPDPRDLIPNISDELRRFLMRATAPEPEARYQNITEVLEDLDPIVDKIGPSALPQPHKKRKIMSLFLFYDDEQQLRLNRLVEEFNNDVENIGAVLRVAELKDI